MNIIIAGDGRIGSFLTRQLSGDGHNLVVIDRNQAVLENTIENWDVMSIQGNCATVGVLRAAEVENADLLIAATGEDELNLLTCMTAHELNPSIHTIARVRNPEYIDTVDCLRERMQLSLTVNPEMQTAREIENLLRYPGFFWRESFAGGRIEIVAIKVESHMPICGKPLKDITAVLKRRVLVCTVLRGKEAIIPDGNFVLEEGDQIYVTASTDSLSHLLHSLKLVKHRTRNVLIGGAGKSTWYLMERLEKTKIDVKLIDKNREACERFATRFPNATVICGDLTRPDVLAEEHVENMDAFISMTGLDELNVVTSLYADDLKVPVIITKMKKGTDFNLVDHLPVGRTVCPAELCGTVILQYVRALNQGDEAAVTIHTIARGRAVAYEFIITEETPKCHVPLKNIVFRKDVLIASITRGRKLEFPDGESFFQPGDRVVVVSRADIPIMTFADIFEGEGGRSR